eukprot:scaffold244_cov416-Prasinococcus_capsulatus_cf.AAC.5
MTPRTPAAQRGQHATALREARRTYMDGCAAQLSEGQAKPSPSRAAEGGVAEVGPPGRGRPSLGSRAGPAYTAQRAAVAAGARGGSRTGTSKNVLAGAPRRLRDDVGYMYGSKHLTAQRASGGRSPNGPWEPEGL